jgi:hypothetical protein
MIEIATTLESLPTCGCGYVRTTLANVSTRLGMARGNSTS